MPGHTTPSLEAEGFPFFCGYISIWVTTLQLGNLINQNKPFSWPVGTFDYPLRCPRFLPGHRTRTTIQEVYAPWAGGDTTYVFDR